ncbi:ROK family glucokinase [Enterocloster bolteae]|uniref:ROK family glucokinase n=1 Tax=Enterocloster bolteae TaxID=208479 RepID=UPI002A82CFE2|nr:ROK family glucokinase [Enterocloster bolteae]
MGMKCIGVDVGGTSVKIGLFEITGELLDKWEVKTRKEEGGTHILPDVARSIRARMEERGLSLKTDLVGIGLGVPGPVMADGFVEVCVNLGWRRMNPQEELSRLLDGVTVKSGNDANVAALGEMWQGGGKGYKDLVMITLGTGVGGGVIIDEKIIAGRHGLGGEIGHIHVRDEEWEHCNCGGVGCVEQICSATGIAREARRKMEASDKPSALREYGADVTAKDVLDAAKAGDELANEVMDVVGRYLGLALSMAVMIVDPEIFVIGGGVSKAGQFLIDVIQKHYDYFTPISEYKGKLGLATLGNDAGIYGAARLVL